MKISAFSRLAIGFFAVLLLLAAGCPVAHATPEVRFQLVRDGLIIVPVNLDGEATSYYFLLDTGAERTVIDTALAKKLALDALGSTKQATVSGTQAVGVSRLGRLAVGPAEIGDLPVMVEDLSSLRRIDRRIDGIVGQNFLTHFNYLLDYRARTMRVEDGGDLRGAIDGKPVALMPMSRGSRMTIAADAQMPGNGTLRLVLDSAANGLVLTGPVASALHFPNVRRVAETSATGSTLLGAASIQQLTVGSREFRYVPVTLAPNAPQGRAEDGLLPTSFFEAIYINNAEGYVILNPREKASLGTR